MEVVIGFFVIMVGTAIYDNMSSDNHEEPKHVELPEKEFFNYDMDATFYKESYSVSFKAKEDRAGVLATTNTVETTVYSPEPQFHSFGFMDPEVNKMNEFKLQFQLEPLNDGLNVDLSYMMKISQNVGDETNYYTKEIDIKDATVVELYNPKTEQYEEVFLEIDVYDVRANQYFINPSKVKCHTDYCEILKNNTQNLLK